MSALANETVLSPTCELAQFTPFSKAPDPNQPSRWIPIVYVPAEKPQPLYPVFPRPVNLELPSLVSLPSSYSTLTEIATSPKWMKEEERLAAAAGLRLEVKNALYEVSMDNLNPSGKSHSSQPLPAADIGIWTATYPPRMFQVFSHLYGLDIDRRLVESANRRNLGQSFTASLGNVLDLPPTSNSEYWTHGPPRTAFFIGVADQLSDAEISLALENMKRLVGPGGKIIVGVQNENCPEVWKLIFQGLLQESDPKSDADKLAELMMSAGLQVRVGGLTCNEEVSNKSAVGIARARMPISPISGLRESGIVIDPPGRNIFVNSYLNATGREKTVTRHYQYRYPGDSVTPEYPEEAFYLLFEGTVPEETK